MFKKIQKFFDENKAELKKSKKIAEKVNSFEPEMEKKTDKDFLEFTQNLKKICREKSLDEVLPEAFAAVREVSKRNTGLRHYDVQIMGGYFLHKNFIPEMRTGEGKTLVATLPVYLNALKEKGVHVVTVNDYLARRDAVWVGQVYSKLGLSVGIINSDNQSFLYDPTLKKDLDEQRDEKGDYKIFYEFLKPCSRAEAYEADITYGTNSEFGFDYLRDNITQKKEDIRQKRGLNFALIDEVDSILIDEARVPLIISAPDNKDLSQYSKFKILADSLTEGEDFSSEEKTKSVSIFPQGIEKAEKFLGLKNLYSTENATFISFLENALKVKSLYTKGKEYLVKAEEVVIVDEFTGRMQPGRRWSGGIHQAIEAKENLKIQQESRTYASVTYQNFFRMYEKLAGMTGTAETSKEEFFKVYSLDVVVIPTNKEVMRTDQNDLVFGTEVGKFKNIAEKIKEINQTKRPVLVGTTSVEKSELLSSFLNKEGVEHTVLNAKNHENEGEIIANAGKKGAVTLSTNMAGRGVDIKLGGADATNEEYKEVVSLGGLFVLGTERHDSRRIDNQLRGRSGRQGDPGETQFFISFEDALMRIFGKSDFIKNMMTKGLGETEAFSMGIVSKQVEAAQTKIEGLNFDSRKNVLQYDDVLNTQRLSFYEKRRKILNSSIENLEKNFEENLFPENLLKIILEKKKNLGDQRFLEIYRGISLSVMDNFWMEHLSLMENLKRSVSLRQDSILEYKKEAKEYFIKMNENIFSKISELLSKLDTEKILEFEQKRKKEIEDSKKILENSGKEEVTKKTKQILKTEEQKIGRNDKCYCGSGKKFKHCHGK